MQSETDLTETALVTSRDSNGDVQTYTDDRGRTFVHLMSDRELLEEMVSTSRATRDLVEGFISSMEQNPMLKSMAGMFGMGKRKG